MLIDKPGEGIEVEVVVFGLVDMVVVVVDVLNEYKVSVGTVSAVYLAGTVVSAIIY